MSVPIPGSPAMDSSPPIPVLLPVALSAEAIGLFEGDRLPAGQVEKVPVLGIMAVQTPTVFLVVMEHDVRVKPSQLSSNRVHGHHAVAIGARENAEGKGRRWNLDSLLLGIGSLGGRLPGRRGPAHPPEVGCMQMSGERKADPR